MAVRGSRGTGARLLSGAAGLGLCLLVLLAGTSVTTAMAARQSRVDAVQPITAGQPATESGAPAGAGLFEVHQKDLVAGERAVTGTYVAALTGSPALPPGLTGWPAEGELYVSPALDELLTSPAGADLRTQIPGRLAGTIHAQGLTSGGDLRFYAGIAPTVDGATALRAQNGVVGWGWGAGQSGTASGDPDIAPYLQILIAAGATLVLVPLALFVTILSRLGAAASARRLAAIRLIGGSAGQLRLLAAGETLVPAILGVVLGSAGFLLARQLAGRLDIGGDGFFPVDFRPPIWAFVFEVLVIPSLAVVAAVVGSMHTAQQPMPTTASRPTMRPRRRWLPVAALVAVGASAVVTELSALFGPVLAAVAVFVMVVLLAIPLLAPMAIRRILHGIGDRGSVAWLLGVRRLQEETTLPGRVVGGVSVVLAGAIALQSLLVGLSGQVPGAARSANHQGSSLVHVDAPTVAELTSVPERIQALGGYSDFRGGTFVFLDRQGTTDGLEAFVGTCAQISQNIGIADCRDGDAFAISDGSSGLPFTLRVGDRLVPAQPVHDDAVVVLPATFRSAPVDPERIRRTDFAPDIVVTPGALGADADAVLASGFTYLLVRPTPGSVAGVASLRGALGELSWRASVAGSDEVLPSSGRLQVTSAVRWGLFAAGLLTLVVTAAGLILVSVQQLLDRRRALTLLVASGVPRSLVRKAMMTGALIPAVVGVAVATVLGTGLSAGLQLALVRGVELDLRTIALYGGCTLIAELAVTAAMLPAVGRLTRLESLRTT